MRHLVLLFGALCVSLAGLCQNSLLWKVSDNVHTHYLYASTDWMRKDLFAFDDSVMISLKAADIFVPQMELNTDNLQAISNALYLPNNRNLRDTLTADKYLLVKEKTERNLKGDFAQYERYEPFTLTKSIQFVHSNADSKVSLADHFQDIASKNAKIVVGLETVKEQKRYLEMLPMDAYLDYFENIDQHDSLHNLMLEAYKKADLNQYTISFIGSDKWATHRTAILAEQNRILSERLKNVMQSGTVFSLIQAEHFWGVGGVLQLLRNAGYKTTPILPSKITKAKFIESQNWTRVLDQTQFFISFPSKYSLETQEIQSELGPLSTTTLRCEATDGDPNISYTITYTDYPAHVIHSDYTDMWDDIFNNSGDAILEALGATLVEESSVSLNNYPGRETVGEFEDGEKGTKYRSFLVENRLYILQVITQRDRITNPAVGKFLDSFELKLK
ncbi:MAG: hypothetical protein RIS47_1809 [Bacteroidota bacterium]